MNKLPAIDRYIARLIFFPMVGTLVLSAMLLVLEKMLRLFDFVATEGGPVEDWARLISSLGVLGETKRARAIFENAREVFANDPAAMDDINRAGERAGVKE